MGRRTIVAEVERLWHDQQAYRRMQRTGNPFGDGAASQRIMHTLEHHFSIDKSRGREAA
jgi:UDP-N-acetylglucosamine 2-epimerase (non-hydrolysing)